MNIKYLYPILICLIFSACSKNNEKITDLEQLKGKRICVLTGSAGDLAARKSFPNARFLDLITASDAALTVKTGKADGFVHNKTILNNIIAKDPQLRILDKPVSQVGIACAFRKGGTPLTEAIKKAIEALRADGTLEAMKQKWIDTKYKSTPLLPVFNPGNKTGSINVGTCAKAEPMTFQSNNVITGFDVELALRIGEITGKKINIIDMNFEGLIPALESGKIDFALSNFNMTEERKKYVDFSEPYLMNDISVLVRK